MTADAFSQHFDPEEIPRLISRVDSVYTFLRRMGILHTWTQDDTFLEWAREWLDHLIDFDNPTAITDDIRLGPHYKTDRNLLILHEYYRWTGDETARRAMLWGVDYQYRFSQFGLSFSGQVRKTYQILHWLYKRKSYSGHHTKAHKKRTVEKSTVQRKLVEGLVVKHAYLCLPFCLTHLGLARLVGHQPRLQHLPVFSQVLPDNPRRKLPALFINKPFLFKH